MPIECGHLITNQRSFKFNVLNTEKQNVKVHVINNKQLFIRRKHFHGNKSDRNRIELGKYINRRF